MENGVKHTGAGIITDKYVIFNDGILSNPYICDIIYDDKNFKSVDHLLMYFKAIFFNDINSATEILNIHEPRLCKKIGRNVTPYIESEWAAVREKYVTYAIYLKFTQNQDCKNTLLKYGDTRKFVQGSRCDSIYGIGLRFKDEIARDETNWKGDNLAGKALDKVYDAIVNNYEITL